MEAFRELQGEGPPPARLHALLCELRAACSADGGLVAALRLDQLLAALVRRPAGVPLGAARALARCGLLLGPSGAIALARACLGVAGAGSRGARGATDEAREGAVHVLGALLGGMGPEAGALLQETAEKLTKFVKSSRTLRDAALAAAGTLAQALGDQTRIMHEPLLKAIKSVLTEKSPVTRRLAAQCLGRLGPVATGSFVETVLEHLMRLLEDADSDVYAEAQSALGKVLGALASRKDEDEWNLVSCVRFACGAIKRSSNVLARGGLGYAITQLLFESKLYVKEEGLAQLVSTIFGLVLGTDDVYQLRNIASHIFRHGIGKTLGTTGRRKLFGILLKSIDNSLSNDWVRVVAFAEMAYLIQELGEECEDLVESTDQVLQKFLAKGNELQALRHAVISCSMALIEAVPIHAAALITQQIELVNASVQESKKLMSHSVALAALLVQGSRTEFRVSENLLNQAWDAATNLVAMKTVATYYAGWAIFGSIFAYGSIVLTQPRIAVVFDALRASFTVNEKLTSDKAVMLYIRKQENVLSAISVLLETCLPLLSEQNIFMLTQVLNQVLSTMGSIQVSAPHVHMYKITLYQVFLALPSQYYQSSAVALLKLLAADILEGPRSARVRKDLYSADFVLESMKNASNQELFESPVPTMTVQELRSKNLDQRLFLSQSSTHVAVVDAAIHLFPVVFTTQSAKRQSQVILHLIKCSSVQSPGQVNVTLNSLCVLSRVLHALTKLRTPLGAGQAQSALLSWTKGCMSAADMLVRMCAARCLGQLCRSEGGSVTVPVAKHAIAILSPPSGNSNQPTEAAVLGATQIIGTLHKMTGAIQIASFQDQFVQLLLARLKVGPHMYYWVLHALWLMIEARGPGFAPLASRTLEAVYGILTGPIAYQDARLCILIGRVANAIVSVLGLELQPGSETFKRFADIAAEMRAHPHPLVQQEALAFQQMLILFAPRTVNVSTLIPHLRRELRSSYVSLRTAAVICTNQLLQMSPDAVLEQEMEQELFFMLDDATDSELNEQLERLIASLVDVLAVSAPSRLIRVCKEILEAKELRKPKGGANAFAGPTGDEGKLKYADEEEEDDEPPTPGQGEEDAASARLEDQTFMPSIVTKEYCLQSISRAVQLLRDSPEHFDLKLARQARETSANGSAGATDNKDFLVFSLRELINMASRAAASSVNSLRREGVLLMELLVDAFAAAVDPDVEGVLDDTYDNDDEDEDMRDGKGSAPEVLLKQYEAAVSSAITSSFNGAPPNVVAAACRVTATFLSSNVWYDRYTLNRLFDLIGGLLENLLDLKQYSMYSWRASCLVQVAVLEAYAKMACHEGPNSIRVGKIVKPLIPSLLNLWFLFLADSVAVSLPYVVDASYSASFFPTMIPLPAEIKRSFAAASPFVLEAASKYADLNEDGPEAEKRRNILVGLCMRGASSVQKDVAAATTSVASLANLLEHKTTVEWMLESGIFDELMDLSALIMATPQADAAKLSCANMMHSLVKSIEPSSEKWIQVLDNVVALLAGQFFVEIPSLKDANSGEGATVILRGSTVAVLSECMRAFASLHLSDAGLVERIVPPLLRLAIACLRLGQDELNTASLLVLRVMVKANGPDWQNVLHASLASLCDPLPPAENISSSLLQASVVLFSSLSFADPQPGVYALMADLYERAFESAASHPTLYAEAVSCFRLLLETSFRVREAKPEFFAQCVQLLGTIGGSFVATCCNDAVRKGEEELKLLVFTQAIAGVVPGGHQATILEVTMPAFVALLNPDTAAAPHDATLTVLVSLAQNPAQSAAFKAAVSKLEPARRDVLQRSLKRKADQDAAAAQVEARKEKQLQSQKERINFGNWAK